MANKNLGIGAGLTPPAIVKAAESIKDLCQQVKAIHESIEHADRMNLERALEAGRRLLKIKSLCKHGEWTPNLKSTGVSSQRASEYMRLAKSPPVGISLSEARKGLAEDENEADEPCQQATLLPVSDGELAASSSAKPGEETPDLAKKSTKPKPPKEREVGDDTEAEKADNPLPFKADRLGNMVASLAKVIMRQREVQEAAVQAAISKIQQGLSELKKLAASPERPPKPPRPSRCRDCGASIIWVETESRKNMPLDFEPGGGQYEIIGGVAVRVEWTKELNASLYKNHFLTCKKRGQSSD